MPCGREIYKFQLKTFNLFSSLFSQVLCLVLIFFVRTIFQFWKPPDGGFPDANASIRFSPGKNTHTNTESFPLKRKGGGKTPRTLRTRTLRRVRWGFPRKFSLIFLQYCCAAGVPFSSHFPGGWPSQALSSASAVLSNRESYFCWVLGFMLRVWVVPLMNFSFLSFMFYDSV